MYHPRIALWLLPAVLLASCSKAPQAPHGKDPTQPDESSGIQGACVRRADRRPCAGARVVLQEVGGPEWGGVQRFGVTTDAAGRFRVHARHVDVEEPDVGAEGRGLGERVGPP